MKDKVLLAACMWGACAVPLWAHPPYVEPHKTAAAFSVAVVFGILTIVLLRRPGKLWIRLLLGVLAFLFCWLIGFVISIITSL